MKMWKRKPRRLTLRGWAAVYDIRKQINNHAEMGEWSAVPHLIFQTLELVGCRVKRNSFWMDVAELFTEASEVNQPTKKFPVLSTKEKAKPLPWEYDGRGWYFWLNLFANNYGWGEEQIGELDIDTAIALFQEISIDEQMEKEWNWGMTDVAYKYNKATQTSSLQPLPRPDWMREMVRKSKPVKKTMIPAPMMPKGFIVNLDEESDASTATQPR